MNSKPTRKAGLHPRNRHRSGYDFEALVKTSAELAPFVGRNRFGVVSVDFADPAAVLALNRALLRHDYGIAEWDIPKGYLCPPIPGRADYIHHAADLLATTRGGSVPRGPAINVLDVGVGANCIYPIVGSQEYGWRFVGSEVDPVALGNAKRIVAANPRLAGQVELRQQSAPTDIFKGIIRPGERYELTLCNPPFHASAADALAGTRRKLKNLGSGRRAPTVLNFGGQGTELWCTGGELGFVNRMIAESADFAAQCGWFTTLISKSENLPLLARALRRAKAAQVATVPMRQGQKQSRILAWTFIKGSSK